MECGMSDVVAMHDVPSGIVLRKHFGTNVPSLKVRFGKKLSIQKTIKGLIYLSLLLLTRIKEKTMSNYAVRPQTSPMNIAYQIAWERKYQELLKRFLKNHKEFDGSSIAAWMRGQGLHDPSHHNMWGTQISYYAKLGWMTPVGYGVPSGAAHIAQVRIWQSNLV